MPEPTMRWEFSLGTLITLAAMGGACAVAWGSMTERSDTTHRGISDLQAAQTTTEARIRTLEMNQARADERLTSILQIVQRIESQLEKGKR